MIEFRPNETKKFILNPVNAGAKVVLGTLPTISIRRLSDGYYFNGSAFVVDKTAINMSFDTTQGYYYYIAALTDFGVYDVNMISTDVAAPLDEIQLFCIRNAQTRLFIFPTDQTQKAGIIKGDTIDFTFDFLEDVSGWKFMFQLTDPTSDEVLKKGSALVTGGADSQIEVETGSRFSRVTVHVLKEETEDFGGNYAEYEIQYLTDSDEQGSKRGRVTFSNETINSSWAI